MFDRKIIQNREILKQEEKKDKKIKKLKRKKKTLKEFFQTKSRFLTLQTEKSFRL